MRFLILPLDSSIRLAIGSSFAIVSVAACNVRAQLRVTPTIRALVRQPIVMVRIPSQRPHRRRGHPSRLERERRQSTFYTIVSQEIVAIDATTSLSSKTRQQTPPT